MVVNGIYNYYQLNVLKHRMKILSLLPIFHQLRSFSAKALTVIEYKKQATTLS